MEKKCTPRYKHFKSQKIVLEPSEAFLTEPKRLPNGASLSWQAKKMRNFALKNPRLLHARAPHSFSWVETELCARTWNAPMHSPPPEAHSPFNAALCPVRTQGGGGGLRALQNPHRNANIGAPISSTTRDAFRRAKKKIEPSAGCASGQSGGVALCFDRVLPFLLCSNAYLCFASSQKVL